MTAENEELAVCLEQFHVDPEVIPDAWKESVASPHLASHLLEERRAAVERMESIGIPPHGLDISTE